MKTKNVLSVVVVLIVAIGVYLFSSNKYDVKLESQSTVTNEISNNQIAKDQESLSHEATFAIYTNGTFRIFTSAMYHDLSEDVYITSANPNLVHVKKKDLTWNDFFKTLPFKLTKDCLTTGTGETFCSGKDEELKFYINGNKNPDALEEIVGEGDMLLVSFGNESENQINSQLQNLENIRLR